MDSSTSQDMVGNVKARTVVANQASFYQRKGKRIVDLVLDAEAGFVYRVVARTAD